MSRVASLPLLVDPAEAAVETLVPESVRSEVR